jgi:hypothetical protein
VSSLSRRTHKRAVLWTVFVFRNRLGTTIWRCGAAANSTALEYAKPSLLRARQAHRHHLAIAGVHAELRATRQYSATSIGDLLRTSEERSSLSLRRVSTIVAAVERGCRARLAEFVTAALVNRYVSALVEDCPHLVEICREILGTPRTTSMLIGALGERQSIVPLSTILMSLLESTFGQVVHDQLPRAVERWAAEAQVTK